MFAAPAIAGDAYIQKREESRRESEHSCTSLSAFRPLRASNACRSVQFRAAAFAAALVLLERR
jgi:hypothetical protein